MIIVGLNGGLGNQMFQYALGKHLALMHNTPLKLDVKWYKKGIREFDLKNFSIEEEIATEQEINLITKMSTSFGNRWQRNIIEPLLPYYKRSVLVEQKHCFDVNVFKSRKDIYMKGYWQTEKYFVAKQDEIRKSFTYKYALDKKNKDFSRLIHTHHAVSVHIRRGDYVSNPEYADRYGVCTIDYYQKAHLFLTSKLANPHYFIFSDDPEWAKQNMAFFQPAFFVSHNQGVDSYKDLLLMSLCKHNLIANSTFSWWAAWLNPHQGKLVIAPRKWFNNQTSANKDLIPDSWIQL